MRFFPLPQLSFDNPLYESAKLQEDAVEFQDLNAAGSDEHAPDESDLLPYHRRRSRIVRNIIISCVLALVLVIIVIALGVYFGSKNIDIIRL